MVDLADHRAIARDDTAALGEGRRRRRRRTAREGRLDLLPPHLSLQSGLPLVTSGLVPITIAQPRLFTRALKRFGDIVAAAALLVMALPLLVAIAFLVGQSGPVIFRQPRVGRNGKVFEIYKFRTFDAALCDPLGHAEVAENDPRVTSLGRLLRTNRLDELPQLINVLKGDMALVGPRPHALNMRVEGMSPRAIVEYYRLRETVRPGISGWAQVNGLNGPTRTKAHLRARVDHDLAYIENLSIGLDIWIVWLTVTREVFGSRS